MPSSARPDAEVLQGAGWFAKGLTMAAALAHARAGDEDALALDLRYDEWDEAKEQTTTRYCAEFRPTP